MVNNKIDGIIALSAFGCGPDSLMVEEVQYHAKEKNLPMIHINLDEQTGEAGFVTRIQAFVDMLIRKKRKTLEKENVINLLHTAVNKNKGANTNITAEKDKQREEVFTK